MTLSFTIDQMITALGRIGYEVKKETVKEYVSYYQNQNEAVERTVYNAYYNGTRIDMWDYLYGTSRLEMVFKMELEKRLLTLLS